jgi:hypothetical protein
MKMTIAISIIVAVCVLAMVLWRYKSQDRSNAKVQASPPSSLSHIGPSVSSLPEPFGYKIAWFAVRSEDPRKVAAALELTNVQPAGWKYGVAHAYGDVDKDYRVFVSPPVRGWVLALGLPILFEADDHAKTRMIELSRKFGEAQFFGSMRVSDVYVWGKAVDGRVVRYFYEGDGNRRVEGKETSEEVGLAFRFFDESSPEAKDPKYWERKDLRFPGEECVLQVAAKWSIDPSQLDKMGLEPSQGLIGAPPASYPPRPR